MNAPNKVIGDLYQLKKSFNIDPDESINFYHIIDNKVENFMFEPCRINSQSVVIYVKPFEVTKKSIRITFYPDVAYSVNACHWFLHRKNVKETHERLVLFQHAFFSTHEWNTKERVSGSTFISPEGKLILISDFDLEHFEKVEL